MDDLTSQIQEARSSGHKDEDILGYIQQNNPEVGAKVKEALSAGHQPGDILDYLSTPAQTSPDPSLASVQGIKEFGKGFAGGAANTAVGLRDVAARTFNRPQYNQNIVPDVPQGLRDFSAPPTTTSGRAGRMLEQGAEAFVPIPGGIEEKALSAVGHLGTAPEAVARVASEVARAGITTGAQSHGDPEATANAMLSAGVVSGALATIGGVLKAIPSDATYLQKKLLFRPDLDKARIKEIVNQAIEDGVRVSPGGALKAQALADYSRGQLDAAMHPYLGSLVPISVVKGPLDQLGALADRIGDKGLKARVNRTWNNFAEAHGQAAEIPAIPPSSAASSILDASGNPIMKPIPGRPGTPAQPAMITLADAQQFKSDFQTLVDYATGTTEGSKKHINELMAQGLKESIESIVPEAKQINRNTQNSILLKEAIEKYLKKNNDIVSPRTAVMMMFNKAAGITFGALSDPGIRSTLAIIKDRMEGPTLTTGTKIAGRVGNAITSPTISLNPQNFSFPPIPTLGGQQ